MKRLTALSILAVLAAASAGCSRCWSSRGAPCQPCVPTASPCSPAIVDPYGGQGTVMTVPSLAPAVAVPAQPAIGPEQYVPAGP